MFEKSFLVAQATRLYRPATRRTEREQRFKPMGTDFSYALRSSGRRVADRSGRVARATYCKTRSQRCVRSRLKRRPRAEH